MKSFVEWCDCPIRWAVFYQRSLFFFCFGVMSELSKQAAFDIYIYIYTYWMYIFSQRKIYGVYYIINIIWHCTYNNSFLYLPLNCFFRIYHNEEHHLRTNLTNCFSKVILTEKGSFTSILSGCFGITNQNRRHGRQFKTVWTKLCSTRWELATNVRQNKKY